MPWYKLKSGTPWYGSKPPYPGAPQIPAPGSEPVDPEPVEAVEETPKKKGSKK